MPINESKRALFIVLTSSIYSEFPGGLR